MKYIFSTLAVFLLACTHCHAQKIGSRFIMIDGPLEEQKRSYFGKVVCSGDDYFIITRYVKSKVFLEKLNTQLQIVKSLEVTEFEDADGKARKFSNAVYFSGNVYLITNKYIKKKSSINYYQAMDPILFELSTNVKVLDETDLSGKRPRARVGFMGMGLSNMMAEVSEAGSVLIFSPDNKKLLNYSKGINKRDGPDFISVKVQNANFETEWENDSIALPYNSLLFDIETAKLNNRGDVFISGIEYNEKRKTKVKNIPNFKYHLIGIFKQGKEIKDYEISLEDKFITACQYKFDGEEYIIVSGFYSESDARNVKGAFFLKVNLLTRAISNVKMKAFDFDFIVSGLSERQQEKQKKKEEKGKDVELLSFYLDDIIMNENGTYSLIAEQFNITTYQTYSAGVNGQPGTWTTHYVYHYNDIIVINISSEGDINWMTKVNKHQSTTDDGGMNSSYVYNSKDNCIYLLYNDHPDNLTQTEPSKFRSYRPGRETAQMIVEIDEKGKMTKELLFVSGRGEVELKPKQCARSTGGDMLLYSSRRKEYQFTFLDFK